jgi:hypothetical protein
MEYQDIAAPAFMFQSWNQAFRITGFLRHSPFTRSDVGTIIDD